MAPRVERITGRVQGARFNLLSANPTKWSNTLKQFVGKLPTNCVSVFDHFVGLALKGSIYFLKEFRKGQDKLYYEVILRNI